ncbi:DUF86 domain-containing protein [Candidatus Peregrinibacteria bacterium]|nr:DUF86 domain-containing protein [Candidatus Peregrinibacteria bacterium]
MKKDPNIFLKHILECIGEIERNTKNLSQDEFSKNITIQDAVVRRLEIIGEAVKNLSDHFKDKYPEILWKKIAGTRDILIHDYFGVEIFVVWKIVEKDIPKLKKQISALLKDAKK